MRYLFCRTLWGFNESYWSAGELIGLYIMTGLLYSGAASLFVALAVNVSGIFWALAAIPALIVIWAALCLIVELAEEIYYFFNPDYDW